MFFVFFFGSKIKYIARRHLTSLWLNLLNPTIMLQTGIAFLDSIFRRWYKHGFHVTQIPFVEKRIIHNLNIGNSIVVMIGP